MLTIIRPIDKRLFDKVVTKPFHPLYGTITHTWDGQRDHYFITNALELPITPLNEQQINDLYERQS